MKRLKLSFYCCFNGVCYAAELQRSLRFLYESATFENFKTSPKYKAEEMEKMKPRMEKFYTKIIMNLSEAEVEMGMINVLKKCHLQLRNK